MSAATTTVVTATVKQDGTSFVCTLDGKEIGRSKHNDYFVYHARRGDVKAIREAGITHFAYVDANDNVTKTEAVKEQAAAADPTAAIAAFVAAATDPAGAPAAPAEDVKTDADQAVATV